MDSYLIPITFRCPVCGEEVKSANEQISCKCITLPYKGKLPGIIPNPSEIIPALQSREGIDIQSIIEETSFRWGRRVAQER